MIHCGSFREREHINPFEPVAFLLAGIREFLTNCGTGDDAGNGNLHVCLQDGGRGKSARLVGSKEQGAFRDFVDAHRRNDAGAERFSRLCEQPGCGIDQEGKGSDQNTEEQTND